RNVTGGQTCALPISVLLAAENHERSVLLLVVHCSVIDVGLWATLLGEVAGVATCNAVQQLVLQANVREGTADHDLVVTTTCAEGVVVLAGNAVLVEVLSSRGARLNGGSRGDVVGGDGVAQQSQDACTLDVVDCLRL